MSNGFKRRYTAEPSHNNDGYSVTCYPIAEIDGRKVHSQKVQVFGDVHLRDYLVELLNNPPDPFKKPDTNQYAGGFVVQGKAYNINGTREAVEAVIELANFFHDFMKPDDVKPAPINEDPFTEIFRRLDEIEKNLFAFSTQTARIRRGTKGE